MNFIHAQIWCHSKYNTTWILVQFLEATLSVRLSTIICRLDSVSTVDIFSTFKGQTRSQRDAIVCLFFSVITAYMKDKQVGACGRGLQQRVKSVFFVHEESTSINWQRFWQRSTADTSYKFLRGECCFKIFRQLWKVWKLTWYCLCLGETLWDYLHFYAIQGCRATQLTSFLLKSVQNFTNVIQGLGCVISANRANSSMYSNQIEEAIYGKMHIMSC